MNTLKTNREFERVFRQGKSAGHRDLVILGRKCRSRSVRVGFCISRKTGNAVVRNKLRRRLREIMRGMENCLKPHWEIVIVARETTPTLTFQGLEKLVLKQLKKLGILVSPVASQSP